MLDRLNNVKTQGYPIALDHFVLGRDTCRLLPYADVIKLDVLALDQRQLYEHINYLKPLKKILLAEKVETYEILEFRSEEHTSELQSRGQLVCRPLRETKQQ